MCHLSLSTTPSRSNPLVPIPVSHSSPAALSGVVATQSGASCTPLPLAASIGHAMAVTALQLGGATTAATALRLARALWSRNQTQGGVTDAAATALPVRNSRGCGNGCSLFCVESLQSAGGLGGAATAAAALPVPISPSSSEGDRPESRAENRMTGGIQRRCAPLGASSLFQFLAELGP